MIKNRVMFRNKPVSDLFAVHQFKDKPEDLKNKMPEVWLIDKLV